MSNSSIIQKILTWLECLIDMRGSQCVPSSLSHNIPLVHNSMIRPVSMRIVSLKEQKYTYWWDRLSLCYNIANINCDTTLPCATTWHMFIYWWHNVSLSYSIENIHETVFRCCNKENIQGKTVSLCYNISNKHCSDNIPAPPLLTLPTGIGKTAFPCDIH